jgi:anti-anti-sigma factor
MGAVRQERPSGELAANVRYRAVSTRYAQREAVSATQSFEVVEAELDGAPGVAIRGEVDLHAVPSLEPALDAAIRDTAGAFVLDLRNLEFLDSSGLRLMLRARALLPARTARSRSSARPVPSGACSSWRALRTCCFSTTRARKRPRRWCRPADLP